VSRAHELIQRHQGRGRAQWVSIAESPGDCSYEISLIVRSRVPFHFVFFLTVSMRRQLLS